MGNMEEIESRLSSLVQPVCSRRSPLVYSQLQLVARFWAGHPWVGLRRAPGHDMGLVITTGTRDDVVCSVLVSGDTKKKKSQVMQNNSAAEKLDLVRVRQEWTSCVRPVYKNRHDTLLLPTVQH